MQDQQRGREQPPPRVRAARRAVRRRWLKRFCQRVDNIRPRQHLSGGTAAFKHTAAGFGGVPAAGKDTRVSAQVKRRQLSLAGQLDEDILRALEANILEYSHPARTIEEEREQHVASLRFHAILAKKARDPCWISQ